MFSKVTVSKYNLRLQQEPHTEALRRYRKYLHTARTERQSGVFTLPAWHCAQRQHIVGTDLISASSGSRSEGPGSPSAAARSEWL